MRSSTDASLPPWPMRILRPWLVASAAGLALGTFLLGLSSEPRSESNAYAELGPRAAVYDTRATIVPDPFAPSASLAAPPDAPPTSSAPAPVAGDLAPNTADETSGTVTP